ncbi:helix-turn-helix transcriptional regulator [Alicyclobacillus sp. ALC3]|uniref:helix-turn-helix transcriptional regulator n=1 Tax=Alicyclobacillus sp. ALC3 TaxID=2796143 RepID=UPI002378D3F7|nr:helix-turn-helix transcriptional regulator [Alicyclobacillus sp. ALC3]WDL96740.1 helix-turn-helix transcriptional regulator [Alicyclobacillus sp. ALC3]
MSKRIGLIRVKTPSFTRARVLRGLSQRDLAQVVDYSVGYVSQVERGISHPSPQAAQQFCRALDKPFDELFYLDDVYKSEHQRAEGAEGEG